MENNFMTFNLKYDFSSTGDLAWENRCDRIVKIINENNPVCIGTQEGLNHMLISMSKKLEEYEYVGYGREGGENGEFNAIFYKKDVLTLIEWNQFALSETPEVPGSKSWDTACERICTYAKFEDKNSRKEFRVYNTHLDHASELARTEGMRVVVEKCKELYLKENIPFIIMGDFNCNSDDKVFELINSYNDAFFKIINLYDVIDHEIVGTFHNFTGIYEEGIIDYILVSKNILCKALYSDERVIDDSYPSDHYPVIANLEIGEF